MTSPSPGEVIEISARHHQHNITEIQKYRNNLIAHVLVSMDSVLQSREADPEEVLFNLGFAESEAFAKIPLRFLKQPSKVNIISIIINYCQASIAFTDKKFFELLDE